MLPLERLPWTEIISGSKTQFKDYINECSISDLESLNWKLSERVRMSSNKCYFWQPSLSTFLSVSYIAILIRLLYTKHFNTEHFVRNMFLRQVTFFSPQSCMVIIRFPVKAENV